MTSFSLKLKCDLVHRLKNAVGDGKNRELKRKRRWVVKWKPRFRFPFSESESSHSPTHTPGSVVTPILQNLHGALLFSRSSARRVPALDSQTQRQERVQRERRAWCPGLGDHPHRAREPRGGDRPRISLGGAAHSGGGRAAKSSTERSTPRRLPGLRPLPGSQRVKPGYEGGPASRAPPLATQRG